MSSPNLTQILNSINQTKKSVFETEEEMKGYPPFIVNKCLSAFHDTILFANEMNINHHLDKKLQYDFFINSINPRKRFSPWAKKTQVEYLDAIKEYYGYNDDKSLQALRILSKDQLEHIKKLVDKGGKK